MSHDRWAWAPLSWTRRECRLTSSVGFGARRIGQAILKDRAAERSFLFVFAFFLPSPCAPLLSSLLAPCSSVQIVPRLHSKMTSLVHPRRFQTEAELNVVRRLLGWSPREIAWGIRAGSVPLRDLRTGEFVLFVSHISTGVGLPISSFFLLLLEDFGLQLQHLTPHSILLVATFAHLCEMFVGVRPCVALFRQFFILVKSGRSKGELGAYYFQARAVPSTPYIPAFASGKWDLWRTEWVIARADANECLDLPTSEPASDRKAWRAKPSLPLEFDPVLEKINGLAEGGLTSMHVVEDFLKRRITPCSRGRG